MGIVTVTTYSCDDCGFTSRDKYLVRRHSCDVTRNGGVCEDYPACGHEAGDCNGLRYGSDESIKESVAEAWRTGHGDCEHEYGIYNCEDQGYDEDDDEDFGESDIPWEER